MVFPVTVLSIVVNISAQSKHTSRGGGGRGCIPLQHAVTSLLLVNMLQSHFAPVSVASLFLFTFFVMFLLLLFFYTLLDESCSSCFFFFFFVLFSSFLHRKTPKYQLGSFTVHFSAMRTHAPSLAGGLAAVSASCLPQNVRPDGRKSRQ